ITEAVAGEVYPIYVEPIKAGGSLYGYLCAVGRGRQISSLDASLVEEAALIMALDFQKRLAVAEIERRYLNDFVRDLLEGRIESRGVGLHRGSIYRWDLTKPQIIFVIRLITPAGHGVLHPSVEGKMHHLLRIERMIREAMAACSREEYLVAHMGDVTIMLFVPRSSAYAEAKRESLDVAGCLLSCLDRGLRGQDLVIKIGISRVCHDFMKLPEAFRDALEAVQLNMEIEPSSAVIHYDDLGIGRLLMRLGDTEEIERYCEDYLGALIRYDQAHGTELLRTLSVVIATDGNLKEAAKKLFVHYNTLRYRLQKIKEVAGIEFSSWQEVARVEVALEAYRILQARKKAAEA
ncbi:MAG: PucR family transcriptional regulator, partial [Thermacetogeniaceae bacterium]